MLLRRIVCPTQHHVSVKSNSWSSLSLVLMILSIFATRFSKSFHYCRRRFSLLRAAAENGIQHKSVFFFFFYWFLVISLYIYIRYVLNQNRFSVFFFSCDLIHTLLHCRSVTSSFITIVLICNSQKKEKRGSVSRVRCA